MPHRVGRQGGADRQFGGRRGDGEPEGGAPALLAFDADRPAHALGQAAADGQAKSGAAELAADRAVDLGEPLEQPVGAGGRNAHAGVGHRDAQASAVGRQIAYANGDAAAACELDGVAEQVQHHLPDAGAVGAHRPGQLAARFQPQRQALVAGLGLDQVDGFAQAGQRVEGLGVQFDLAGLYLGEVQHVVDHRQQGLAGGGDAVGEGPGLLRQPDRLLQQAGEADDAGERGADLVAHVGQELALGDGRGLSLGHLAHQHVFHGLALGDVAQLGDGADRLAVLVAED